MVMNPSRPPYSRANGASGSRSSLQTSSRTPRGSTKRNTSILNFFTKTETPTPPKVTQNRITQYVARDTSKQNDKRIEIADAHDEGPESLFIGEDGVLPSHDAFPRRSKSPDNGFELSTGGQPGDGYDEYIYNGSIKRRKLGYSPNDAEIAEVESEPPGLEGCGIRLEAEVEPTDMFPVNARKDYGRGPFVDESDSDEDSSKVPKRQSSSLSSPPPVDDGKKAAANLKQDGTAISDESGSRMELANAHSTVALEYAGDSSEAEDTPAEANEVFSDTECDNAFDCDPSNGVQMENYVSEAAVGHTDDEAAVCPICRVSLEGMTDAEASRHVNDCLDGSGPSHPGDATTRTTSRSVEPKVTVSQSDKKLVARPAQGNPFDLGSKPSTTSAFSKLMSAKAEDSAWATAAASEVASRGKQSYERTCPFYKILPGFSVCVDAFRYGAVEGCSAYFLSHFHSDHYMGLTASWHHGPIYCSRVTGNLVRQQLKVDPKMVVDIEWDTKVEVPDTGGVHVTMVPANHCPGSSLFLFEKPVGKGKNPKIQRILHCGDFRASPEHIQHPLLRPEGVDPITGRPKEQTIDVCYLDTTYLNPKYAFPAQGDVVSACAEKCRSLNGDRLENASNSKQGPNLKQYLSEDESKTGERQESHRGRLLVVIGTYSIGKERICLGIARGLKSKIYVPAAKRRICSCLEDEELSSLLTSDPHEAQVHMHSLMEIRADTLLDYLDSFRPHFSRVAGFRPTGWNYRPPAGRQTDSPAVQSVLHSDSWKARFVAADLVAQRGSSSEAMCFSVPYSEHSSFRELTMFCCALRISRVIPTVNVGSARSRERMKVWMDRWQAEKRKSGLFKVEAGAVSW